MNRDLPRWWSVYAKQEYMTPGVEETVQIAESLCGITASTLVLDVAFGKGEAACQMAVRQGCSVLGVDIHSRADYARDKAIARGLSGRVSFLRAEGGRLPLAAAIVDVALCTGGPSIIGTGRCLAEMHRVLKPGGWAVVSDWIWRSRPVPPEAVPRSWPKKAGFILLEEYASGLRLAGFEVVLAHTLPVHVWHDYYRPMLEAAVETNEPRIFYEGPGRRYWGYGVFIARKLPVDTSAPFA